jgi:hypothetical protein
MDTVGRGILSALYYIMPNLERFNLKGHVINHVDLSADDLLLTFAYGASYTVMLLVLASMIFQRRDFQ